MLFFWQVGALRVIEGPKVAMISLPDPSVAREQMFGERTRPLGSGAL